MQFLAAGIAQRAAGQNMMMRVANVAKQLRLLGTRKEGLRIGAKKREAVMRGEAVPELLETQRGIAESLLAENRDHLSERMQWLSALRGLGDDRADRRDKAGLVGPAVDHEAIERGLCVEQDKRVMRGGLRGRSQALIEPRSERRDVIGRGDDDRAAA